MIGRGSKNVTSMKLESVDAGPKFGKESYLIGWIEIIFEIEIRDLGNVWKIDPANWKIHERMYI